MKENKPKTLAVVHHRVAAPTRSRSTREDAEMVHAVLPEQRLRRARRSASRRSRRSRRRRTARRAGSGCAFRSMKASGTRSASFNIADNNVHQDRVPGAALQDEGRRLLRRETAPEGHREDERDLRHGRLLAVGARRRHPPARHRPRDRAAASTRGDAAADRRRHHQDGRGQAVLRQPHHVPRQHDDARRGHPARAARLRKATSSTARRSRTACAG